MDGGVLDNIPLGKALRAIAAVPAATPTRRMLVYIQPGMVADAGTEPPDSGNVDARRSTVGVIRGAIGALAVGETIAGDIAQLEAHNEAIQRAVTMRLGTLSGVGDGGLVGAATERWVTYQPLRADFDARLVRSLLDDPLAVLGNDPFPKAVGDVEVSDDTWRSPIAAWPANEREHLVGELAWRFTARLSEGGTQGFAAATVIGAGVRPLLRTVTLLLEWARHLEGLGR